MPRQLKRLKKFTYSKPRVVVQRQFKFHDMIVGYTNHRQMIKRLTDATSLGYEVFYEEYESSQGIIRCRGYIRNPNHPDFNVPRTGSNDRQQS